MSRNALESAYNLSLYAIAKCAIGPAPQAVTKSSALPSFDPAGKNRCCCAGLHSCLLYICLLLWLLNLQWIYEGLQVRAISVLPAVGGEGLFRGYSCGWFDFIPYGGLYQYHTKPSPQDLMFYNKPFDSTRCSCSCKSSGSCLLQTSTNA